MRCKEALALATFSILNDQGGEIAKKAFDMDEDELARIGRRIARAGTLGTYTVAMNLGEIVKQSAHNRRRKR